ncbi:hypothetical protein DMZ48_00170 [Robertkochia solimangrovi]|nr:hypothetical protein DMZ48_00170 [Robertkochia solimangrovi]
MKPIRISVKIDKPELQLAPLLLIAIYYLNQMNEGGISILFKEKQPVLPRRIKVVNLVITLNG